jgi:Mg2+ and Co2+ transporter CorA
VLNKSLSLFLADLHGVQADLLDLKMKLAPVQALVRGLRTGIFSRFTGESSLGAPRGRHHGENSFDSIPTQQEEVSSTRGNQISDATRLYLRDVQDHIDTSIDSVHSLLEWSQNLIELAFSIISYQTNENMKLVWFYVNDSVTSSLH